MFRALFIPVFLSAAAVFAGTSEKEIENPDASRAAAARRCEVQTAFVATEPAPVGPFLRYFVLNNRLPDYVQVVNKARMSPDPALVAFLVKHSGDEAWNHRAGFRAEDVLEIVYNRTQKDKFLAELLAAPDEVRREHLRRLIVALPEATSYAGLCKAVDILKPVAAIESVKILFHIRRQRASGAVWFEANGWITDFDGVRTRPMNVRKIAELYRDKLMAAWLAAGRPFIPTNGEIRWIKSVDLGVLDQDEYSLK